MGEPWSEEKVLGYVVQLRASLVTPYQLEFRLSDTVSQMKADPPENAKYWVVAVSSDYIEFYDPQSGEYGLATQGRVGGPPSTIGVRGDLVGVFWCSGRALTVGSSDRGSSVFGEPRR